MNIFAFTATYFIYKVFSFSFSSSIVNDAVFIAMILAMAAIVIAAFDEFMMLMLMLKKRFTN